jgi:hypothetical protein
MGGRRCLSWCGHPVTADQRHIDVGQKTRSAAPRVRLCVNCGSSLSGPDTVAAAAAVAWYWHCRACAGLAAGQMDLAADRPEGLFIQIYRCRRCGSSRSCRPGWQTRCHVCLDERSSGLVITDAAQRFRAMLASDTGLQ